MCAYLYIPLINSNRIWRALTTRCGVYLESLFQSLDSISIAKNYTTALSTHSQRRDELGARWTDVEGFHVTRFL